MGIRNLRIDGDPLLRKVSREVTELNDKIRLLIEDMMDTMIENDHHEHFCSEITTCQ